MQNVSQAWKDAQKLNFLPESCVEISLNIGDPDAQADTQPSDNGHYELSNTAGVCDRTAKERIKYATLERHLWRLNGSYKIAPSEGPYADNGYTGSEMSDENGEYSVAPTITITFASVYEALIPGVTITWSTVYEEWAESFRIIAYNGSSIVAQKIVEGNKDIQSAVLLDIENYDRITVEVLKWCLPRRRARIEQIFLGIIKTYSKREILNLTHEMTVDPLSASLPKAGITFELLNLNGEYNPENPDGTEKYLMERQEVSARYGFMLNGAAEWLATGTFFLSEWDTPQNGITATFAARDVLEYMGDLYTGSAEGTLLSIARAALVQAGLPIMSDGSARWVLDESLGDIVAAAGADLSGNTIAEVLQYVANAGCCVLYQDRSGRLHIEPLADGVTDYRIGRFHSYSNSEISLLKQLKAVNVNNGQYILTVGNAGETQQVNNPLISAERAPVVAQWVADVLSNRREFSGEYRPDPRLDALDRVTVENRFAESIVLVTEIKYTYNGAFCGNYVGRAGV